MFCPILLVQNKHSIHGGIGSMRQGGRVMYISEMIEYSPLLKDLDEKIKRITDAKSKEGFSFVSKSLVGRAWAILVFKRV